MTTFRPQAEDCDSSEKGKKWDVPPCAGLSLGCKVRGWRHTEPAELSRQTEWGRAGPPKLVEQGAHRWSLGGVQGLPSCVWPMTPCKPVSGDSSRWSQGDWLQSRRPKSLRLAQGCRELTSALTKVDQKNYPSVVDPSLNQFQLRVFPGASKRPNDLQAQQAKTTVPS